MAISRSTRVEFAGGFPTLKKLGFAFGLFLLIIGGLSLSAAELTVIRDGQIKGAKSVAGRWTDGEGYIYSTGTHYLIPAQLPAMTSVLKLGSWSKSQELRQQLQAKTGTREFAGALLAASDEQMETLAAAKQARLLELAAVHLPTNPKDDNDHFGWPVATMIDDTIIVVHRSMPGHNAKVSGPSDKDTTYATILRSTDGGKTWSQPYDLRDCMTEADRNRGGSVPLCHRFKFDPESRSPLGYKLPLNSIGTTRDGAVIVVTDHGVFRSEDKGRSWKHLRLAFREDRHEGPFAYVGPHLIDDPKPGLLIFAHQTIYRSTRRFGIADESVDEGQFVGFEEDLGVFFPRVEAAAAAGGAKAAGGSPFFSYGDGWGLAVIEALDGDGPSEGVTVGCAAAINDELDGLAGLDA
jgi:hypothetical protein